MTKEKPITDDQIALAEDMASKGLMIKDIAYTLGLNASYCSQAPKITTAIQEDKHHLDSV